MNVINSLLGSDRKVALAVLCYAALAACSSDPEAGGISRKAGSTSGAGASTGGAQAEGGGPVGAAGATISAAGATISAAGAGGGFGGSAGAGSGGVAGSGGAFAGTGGVTAGASGTGGGSDNCNGAVLCDSFERADLGADWVLDNSVQATTIELVSTKAHSGDKSVHISWGTVSTQSYISEMKTFPAMGEAFWGRAWIFTSLTTAGHQIYVEARVASGSDKTGVRPVNTQGTTLGLNLESSDAGTSSKIAMKMGSWVCYEWQITGIGGSGTFSAYADGTLIGMQKGTIPALKRQRIGFQRYEAGTAGELWIDDVAIGATRIGCM